MIDAAPLEEAAQGLLFLCPRGRKIPRRAGQTPEAARTRKTARKPGEPSRRASSGTRRSVASCMKPTSSCCWSASTSWLRTTSGPRARSSPRTPREEGGAGDPRHPPHLGSGPRRRSASSRPFLAAPRWFRPGRTATRRTPPSARNCGAWRPNGLIILRLQCGSRRAGRSTSEEEPPRGFFRCVQHQQRRRIENHHVEHPLRQVEARTDFEVFGLEALAYHLDHGGRYRSHGFVVFIGPPANIEMSGRLREPSGNAM